MIKPPFHPISICLDEGVGEFDELSHQRSDGDLWRLSCFDHGLVFSLKVGVVSHRDQGRHVEGIPNYFTAPLNE